MYQLWHFFILVLFWYSTLKSKLQLNQILYQLEKTCKEQTPAVAYSLATLVTKT
jgi:hypothetical protein